MERIMDEFLREGDAESVKVIYEVFGILPVQDIIDSGLCCNISLLKVVCRSIGPMFRGKAWFRRGKYEKSIVAKVVEKGNIECLKYLHSHDYPMEDVCALAAYHKHPEILEYAIENGIHLDLLAVFNAIESGCLKCFELAFEGFQKTKDDHSEKQKSIETVLNKIIERDRVDMMNYALAHSCNDRMVTDIENKK
jgi:hypothetical protein